MRYDWNVLGYDSEEDTPISQMKLMNLFRMLIYKVLLTTRPFSVAGGVWSQLLYLAAPPTCAMPVIETDVNFGALLSTAVTAVVAQHCPSSGIRTCRVSLP